MQSGLVCFAFVIAMLLLHQGNTSSDVRPRFEGLVGKTVQAAWRNIDLDGSLLLVVVVVENPHSLICLFQRRVERWK